MNLEHDRGCAAHSDGDVLMHCIVDSILGALGLPDIGQIFPDTDPKWKGCTSDVFMREAVRLMKEAGKLTTTALWCRRAYEGTVTVVVFRVVQGIIGSIIMVIRMLFAVYSIGNMDSTIILQKPKLSPHKAAIKENICELLDADPSVINIKAKVCSFY